MERFETMENLTFDSHDYIHLLGNWQYAIIDLHEIKLVLRYQDMRSVLKWCGRNEVFVITQGNTQVVNLIEFILAFYRPYLEHLKRTKENWNALFWNYVCANLSGILSEKGEQRQQLNQYKPKTNIERSFLKKMKNV